MENIEETEDLRINKIINYAELETNDYKEIIILPEDKDISSNRVTKYEIAQLVVEGINRLNKGFPSTLDMDDLYIDTADINTLTNPQGNIKLETKNGEERIKLSSSTDIARREINLGKSPFLIHRVLLDTGNKLYVVKKNPNNMIRPIV